jgi:hypothetical protein
MYLDFVTLAAIPEDCDQRLTEMFPGAFEHLCLLAFDPYTSRWLSWNVTSGGTEMM